MGKQRKKNLPNYVQTIAVFMERKVMEVIVLLVLNLWVLSLKILQKNLKKKKNQNLLKKKKKQILVRFKLILPFVGHVTEKLAFWVLLANANMFFVLNIGTVISIPVLLITKEKDKKI